MANVDLICPCCKEEFIGRTNAVYCGARCRKKVERSRKKFAGIIADQEKLLTSEIEALESLDYNEVRRMRARRQRLLYVIDELYEIPAMRNDRELEIKLGTFIYRANSLKRKEPRLSVAVDSLWNIYKEIENKHRKLPLITPRNRYN